MKKILLVLIFIAVIGMNFAFAVPNPTLLSVHGYVTQGSPAVPVASGDIKIEIWTDIGRTFNPTDYVGGETFAGAVQNGNFDLLVGSTKLLRLEYNNDYFMDVTVNGTKIGGPYKFRGGQGMIGPEDLDASGAYTFRMATINETLLSKGLTMLGDAATDEITVRGTMACATGGSINAASCGITGGTGGTPNLLQVLTAGSDASTYTGMTLIGGLLGVSVNSGFAVIGSSASGTGVAGTSETGYAGRFYGKVDITDETTIQGGKAWHSKNDGVNSGLDADLIDGVNLYWKDMAGQTKICFHKGCTTETVACNTVLEKAFSIPTCNQCDDAKCASLCVELYGSYLLCDGDTTSTCETSTAKVYVGTGQTRNIHCNPISGVCEPCFWTSCACTCTSNPPGKSYVRESPTTAGEWCAAFTLTPP